MNASRDSLPVVYVARHGETAWTLTGQHTGLTDLPLTPHGEQNAKRLHARLASPTFTAVLTSPLQRAQQTCELAGFGDRAEVDRDLVEWNYGDYEGLTTAQIQQQRADWELFRDGCPGGEMLDDVAARANRVIERIRAVDGDVLVFSSSHFLRVFAAFWLGVDPTFGRGLLLGTAALSIVGYHRVKSEPVIRLWNDCGHACS